MFNFVSFREGGAFRFDISATSKCRATAVDVESTIMQLFDYCRESVAYDLASTGFDRTVEAHNYQ